MSDATYRILFVCTGNICRSPFMERLMRARLDESLGPDARRIDVSSAGTGALVGEPMTADAAEILREYGGDPDGFVARLIQAEDVEAADLVLTATRDHRTLVATDVAGAVAKTATLREFARLLTDVTSTDVVAASADPAVRMAAIADTAFARRRVVPRVGPTDDDIPDPYRGPRDGYVEAAQLIDAALDVTLGLLVPR